MKEANINKAAGEVLRGFRLRENLDQQWLAKDMRLTRQQIWRYETGRTSITFDLLIRLCKVLRVQPETFTDAVLKKYRKALKQSIKESGK